MYDLLITNGLIIDGTGSAPYQADVAVSQGNIVAIGSLPDTAQHSLDAAGLVVSPGFIDLHTHSDLSFLLDPTAQSKVRQGVTLYSSAHAARASTWRGTSIPTSLAVPH
jgi:N-acyl-D-amino-acid deacylase